MSEYSFTESDIEIINALAFDASVDFGALTNLTTSNQIDIELERRTFENVNRLNSYCGHSPTTMEENPF